MKNHFLLAALLIGLLPLSLTGQSPDCRQVYRRIDSLSEAGLSHRIPGLADRREACLLRKIQLAINRDERLATYQAIGDAYLRHLEPEKARRYARALLFVDPEYFQVHPDSDLRHLFSRIAALKFTVGFQGWAGWSFPRLANDRRYQPGGAISSDERLSNGGGLVSSLFAGVELIHNPLHDSKLRSIDLYGEWMFQNTRFVHVQETTFPPSSGKPEQLRNQITETQDWNSVFVYPRIRFYLPRLDPFAGELTWYFLAGVGFHWLQSADFFTVEQTLNGESTAELPPVKLYPRERMRNRRNTSLIAGVGGNYRLSALFALRLELRYLRMLDNLVSEESHAETPLQEAPYYYVDNDIFLNQLFAGIGIALNIGAGL